MSFCGRSGLKVFASGNASKRSFIRFHNVTDQDGEATVHVFAPDTSAVLSKYRQSVLAHAAVQVEIV